MIARSQEEIAALREGGKRLGKILQTLGTLVRPGLSTEELENMARALIAEGGDKAAFLDYKPRGARRPYPAALCVSVNEEIVHGIPNEDPRTLEEGDVVTLDLGLIHEGLVTDAAVCVIAGKADPEDARLVRCTQEALSAGITKACIGNTIGDIGHAVEKVGDHYGFAFPYELGGHSVGTHVHEEPFIPNYGKPGEGERLVEGLVLAIEPMFMRGRSGIELARDGYTYRTKDRSRTAHVEHTIIVTKDGPEILTRA